MNKNLKNKKVKAKQRIAKTNKGITLVALIITIIVLLILAVVAIQAVKGDGILAHAKNARDKWEEAQRNEEIALDQLTGSLNGQTTTGYNEEKKVNAPELKTGMVPVKYDTDHWVVTTKDDPEWYNYLDTDLTIDEKNVEAKRWANVMLRDGLKVEDIEDASTASIDSMNGKKVNTEGSMFVWIPRFAYKITKLTVEDYKDEVVSGSHTSTVTDRAGTIDIIFLQGNTDYYGAKKATRGTGKSETEYVVHPSFTNDVNLGGWDRELTGYWVAKFEAGFSGTAGDPNSAKDSNVYYTRTFGSNQVTGKNEDILNNYYGEKQIAESKLEGENAKGKAIKYPTFTGNRLSFNYISIGDSYSLCLSLNASGNPYKLNNNSDPHLMKNSEWGAVAYLSHSKYGRSGTEITRNEYITKPNDTLTDTQISWATTGGGNYKENTTQSSTGNIYGIYDLSGGINDRVASYVNNGSEYIAKYGASMQVESSTKYVTLYQQGESDERVPNYIVNKAFYGDAIEETSRIGDSKTNDGNCYYDYSTWFHSFSYYPDNNYPFFTRGCIGSNGILAGSFAFDGTDGLLKDASGFRAVIV